MKKSTASIKPTTKAQRWQEKQQQNTNKKLKQAKNKNKKQEAYPKTNIKIKN